MTSLNVRNEERDRDNAPDAQAESECALRRSQCASREIGKKLRDSGLRCTRQRIELGRLLFATGHHRHVTADILYEEVREKQLPVALATIYNTLQLFVNVGLLRRLPTGGQKAWFDTNVSEHHHLILDDESLIIDIPPGYLTIQPMPPIPEDMEVDRIDVIVQLKRSTCAPDCSNCQSCSNSDQD